MYQKIAKISLADMEVGSTKKYFLKIVEDGLGRDITIPVFIAMGKPGPVLGLTAAIHGNELNGVQVIAKFIKDVEKSIDQLQGTIIAVPVVNTVGALNHQREFGDGVDLNRIMPGKPKGDRSQRFAFKVMKEIISHFDYHVDLHTASFGRVNSFYVRADLSDPETKQLAFMQHPQIVVHTPGKDGSLRGAAAKKNIKSITVEIGDPQRLQKGLIKATVVGIQNIISSLKMLPIKLDDGASEQPVVCQKSYWIYTKRGGILDVLPQVTDHVSKGDRIAVQYDVFGELVCEYTAPEDGVVIGKSTNPVSESGSRILHLGVVR